MAAWRRPESIVIRPLLACCAVLAIGGCSSTTPAFGSLEIPGQVGTPVIGTYTPTTGSGSPRADVADPAPAHYQPLGTPRQRPPQQAAAAERKVEKKDCQHTLAQGLLGQLSYSSFSPSAPSTDCPG